MKPCNFQSSEWWWVWNSLARFGKQNLSLTQRHAAKYPANSHSFLMLYSRHWFPSHSISTFKAEGQISQLVLMFLDFCSMFLHFSGPESSNLGPNQTMNLLPTSHEQVVLFSMITDWSSIKKVRDQLSLLDEPKCILTGRLGSRWQMQSHEEIKGWGGEI